MKKGIAGFLFMVVTGVQAFVWAGNGVERGNKAIAWSKETQDLHQMHKAKVEEALRKACPGLMTGEKGAAPVHIVRFRAQGPGTDSMTSHRYVVEAIPGSKRLKGKRVNVVIESASDNAIDPTTRVVSSSAPGLCSSR